MATRSQKDLPAFSKGDILALVKGLLNQEVKVTYHDRGKDSVIYGVVSAVYSNLFVLRCEKNGESFNKTFTYSDVLSEGITLEKK